MNSDDLSKLIGNMMQNPDALKGLLSPAENSGENQAPSVPQDNPETAVKNMMSVLNQSDDRRITLLNALKPYLSPTRASGIDRAIRILRLTKLSEMLRNERD